MKKASAEAAIADLPETFDLDLLVQKLILMEQIEKARQEIENGLGSEQDDVEARFYSKWAK